MVKNKITIYGFNAIEETEIVKEGRKAPTVETEVRNAAVKNSGRALIIKDYKALRIFMDGTEIKEDNFIKLFPNSYQQFNIKKTIRMEKGKAVVETYLYFPYQMVEDHQIKVRYRQKMKEVIYSIIVEKEIGEEINKEND